MPVYVTEKQGQEGGERSSVALVSIRTAESWCLYSGCWVFVALPSPNGRNILKVQSEGNAGTRRFHLAY